jgi:hypothetical protein
MVDEEVSRRFSQIVERIARQEPLIVEASGALGIPLEDLIAAAARKIAAERVIDARQMELPGTAPAGAESGGAA